MSDRVESYENLMRVLDDLRSLPPTSIILVEGKKDRMALRSLGVRSVIAPVNSSRPLEEIVSGYEEAVLLLDYDRRGSLLTRSIERRLRASDVKPNLEYRIKIRRFTMGELSHIEGLRAYIRGVARKSRKIKAP